MSIHEIWKMIRLRLRRNWSLKALGPNEARLLFDGVVGSAAVGGVWFYNWLTTGAFGGVWLVLSPVIFLSLNLAFGLYTRLKSVSARAKVVVLCCAVSGAVGCVGWWAGGHFDNAVLWGMLTLPTVCLARVLLNIPYARNRGLLLGAVRQKGPILVAGGAGYIGTHVVDLLLKRGEQVRVLDRLMYGRESMRDFLSDPRFEMIEGDVMDVPKLAAAMKGVSGVVHLAGLVGDPACAVDADFTRHTNIITTRLAKDIAQSLGIHRFIFASSCSVYGVSEKEVKEGDSLNPVSLYAQTKIDSENELLTSVKDEFFVTILRFATVFGHSRRPRFDLVCNLFVAQAMTNGIITVVGPDQWRPFIHVRDLARAVVLVLTTPTYAVQSQIFNVGDRRLNMTILQLAEGVKKVVENRTGKKVEITVKDTIEDRRNYAVSFEKIQKTLGFEAETFLEDGVAEIVEHFQKGSYEDYRSPVYSNVAVTREAVEAFRDPMQAAGLYAPLGPLTQQSKSK